MSLSIFRLNQLYLFCQKLQACIILFYTVMDMIIVLLQCYCNFHACEDSDCKLCSDESCATELCRTSPTIANRRQPYLPCVSACQQPAAQISPICWRGHISKPAHLHPSGVFTRQTEAAVRRTEQRKQTKLIGRRI